MLCHQRDEGLNLVWNHLLVVWLQAGYLTSLSLSSLLCNLRIRYLLHRAPEREWQYLLNGVMVGMGELTHERTELSQLSTIPFIRSLCAGPRAEGFRCYVPSLLTNQGRYSYSHFVGQEIGSERLRGLSEITLLASPPVFSRTLVHIFCTTFSLSTPHLYYFLLNSLFKSVSLSLFN